jgi:hypothetical protein
VRFWILPRIKPGKIWVLNRAGWLMQPAHGTTIEPPADFSALYGNYGLALARDGTLWCLRRGRLEIIRDHATRLWDPPDEPIPPPVQAICAARAGGIWISIEGRVKRFDAGRWQTEPANQPWRFQPVGCLTELAGGGLVVGTEQSGLYRWEEAGSVQHLSRTNGLGQDWVRAVIEDREGTVWVGLGNGGLTAIHQVSFEQVNPPDAWGGRAVLSLAAGRDGNSVGRNRGGGNLFLARGNLVSP